MTDVLFDTKLKAPFPCFGGKGLIADTVWSYLGDVKQYIEPFFGSGAVLLKRPQTKHEQFYEIVNDKDGFIANVWRSIKLKPDETTKWCDWPVNHADLVARKKELIKNEEMLLLNLQEDPEWSDPKLAGYWIWCASCWIGSGMLCPSQIPHLTGNAGINSQIPHLTGNKGINSKIPYLDSRRKLNEMNNNVHSWLSYLSQRLRYVKVVCGDWSRVCGGNWQDNNKPVGMFFDPPYATSTRHKDLYYKDSMTVGKDVEKWVLERGKNPNYRIVVCGYDDEYRDLVAAGWRTHNWKACGGYGNQNSKANVNAHREVLYVSPYCCSEMFFGDLL